VRFLAVSGSLRAASSNSRLIEALPHLCPAPDEVVVYRGLGDLPHFNPDLDGDSLPAVAYLRRLVGDCDGLIICSPEYAHGVAGSMKNGLDWLVPSLEFPNTPVCLLNAAPLAHHAQAHIRETLVVMQGRVVESASIAVPLQGRNLDTDDIVADASLAGLVKGALAAFAAAIRLMPPKPDWT
jgi:chromate reductase